jgi:hypothetical protein
MKYIIIHIVGMLVLAGLVLLNGLT